MAPRTTRRHTTIDRPIRTDEELDAYTQEIDELLDQDPAPGTPAYDRLELLSLLVEAYEEEHYPIEDPAPADLVDFMLEQKGVTRADLHDAMGGRSRVSEFFSGARPLSLNQARALRDLLGVPLDALIPVTS